MLRNTGQYYDLIKPWSESFNIFKLSRRDFVEKDKTIFFFFFQKISLIWIRINFAVRGNINGISFFYIFNEKEMNTLIYFLCRKKIDMKKKNYYLFIRQLQRVWLLSKIQATLVGNTKMEPIKSMINRVSGPAIYISLPER